MINRDTKKQSREISIYLKNNTDESDYPIKLISMKHIIFLFSILWMFTFGQSSPLMAQSKTEEIVMMPRDKEIVETILKQLKTDQKLETGSLVIKVGQFFLGTPYVASTLEISKTEKMVINLRELDCTTFAENCLALARTIKKENPTFNDFVSELRFIRYRDGKLNGYPSRLHYFSDWIYNNDQKKLVKSFSKDIANIGIDNRVNFMSTHPESYPLLKNNPDFVKEIAIQENAISNRKYWYIPKERLIEFEQQLHDGDILGITTTIQGMDISHVVIAIRKDGRIHLLHASLNFKKVLVSTETLEQYLNAHKSTTGIMVARPL